MKFTKQLHLVLFGIATLFISGCETQVAIDPISGVEQTARYQAGFFFGVIEGELDPAFRTTIQTLDEQGYFRTGERHVETAVSIFARKIGDEKIVVRLKQTPEAGELEVRIRVGNMGNLAESQTIFAAIREAL
jgi:hypothetical protein|tara:strand:+ start:13981 stop:14379 length:399 start_codon:yes stop_codon:yes gene_type:complete